MDKSLNEYDNNEPTKNIMSRRMDLIVTGNLTNDLGKEERIELESMEIKKVNVTDDVTNAQLNKNIHINKSILKRLNNHISSKESISSFETLGLDIIGTNGFTYVIRPFESIVIALRTCNEPMFLPMDDDDFKEFLFSTTLDQLLNYKEHNRSSQTNKQIIINYVRFTSYPYCDRF